MDYAQDDVNALQRAEEELEGFVASAEEAVADYLERNPARVNYWCTGRMSAS